MLHVRFKRSKHPHYAVNYLLGVERDRELAFVIRGDIDRSLEIAKANPHKHKYSCGCLSFEEPDLSTTQKLAIMKEFERTLFPGLEEHQYNISWVQHTDKDRLELNYFIPTMELTSKKSLTPYFHKTDKKIVNDFVAKTNEKYHLTDPNQAKQSLVSFRKRTPEYVRKIGDEIVTKLQDEGLRPDNTDQVDIVYELKSMGYEIALRKSGKNQGKPAISDNSISIIDPEKPERNIRLCGAYFKQRNSSVKKHQVDDMIKRKIAFQKDRYKLKIIPPEKLIHGGSIQNKSVIGQCCSIVARTVRRTSELAHRIVKHKRYKQYADAIKRRFTKTVSSKNELANRSEVRSQSRTHRQRDEMDSSPGM